MHGRKMADDGRLLTDSDVTGGPGLADTRQGTTPGDGYDPYNSSGRFQQIGADGDPKSDRLLGATNPGYGKFPAVRPLLQAFLLLPRATRSLFQSRRSTGVRNSVE